MVRIPRGLKQKASFRRDELPREVTIGGKTYVRTKPVRRVSRPSHPRTKRKAEKPRIPKVKEAPKQPSNIMPRRIEGVTEFQGRMKELDKKLGSHEKVEIEKKIIPPSKSAASKSRIPLGEVLDEKRLKESIRANEMAKAENEAKGYVNSKLEEGFDLRDRLQAKDYSNRWGGMGFTTNEKDGFEEDMGFYGLYLRGRGNKQTDDVMLRIYNRWKAKRIRELQDRSIHRQGEIASEIDKWKYNQKRAETLIEERRRIIALPAEKRKEHYGGEVLTGQGEVRKKLQREISSLQSEPWALVSARNDVKSLGVELTELQGHEFTKQDMAKLIVNAQADIDEHTKSAREGAEHTAKWKIDKLDVTRQFLKKTTEHSFRGTAEPVKSEDYRLKADSNGETYTVTYNFKTGTGRTKTMEIFAGDYDRLSEYVGKLIPSMRDDMKQYWSQYEGGEENASRLPSMEWSEKARDKVIADLNEAKIEADDAPSTADVYLIKTALNDTERAAGGREEGSSTGAARLIKSMIGEGNTFKVSHGKADLDQMDAAHIRMAQGTIDVSDLKLKDGNYYIARNNEFIESEDEPKSVANTPRIHPTVTATIETSVLKKAVKDITMQSDEIHLTGAEKQLILSGKGEAGSGRVAFGTDNPALLAISIEEEERGSSKYDANYLNDTLRNLPSDYKTISLKFDKDKPLTLETENEKTGDKLKLFLAPRVHE